ncbi:MAG: ATP-dependent DNA ligase [Candidatus Micrarchaeota archaeon]|nr:ATP-dependent DNA ligase [Candidatus Micrarchaeota archaeon]
MPNLIELRYNMQFSKVCLVFDAMEETASRLALTDLLAKLFSETDKTEVKKLVYLCQGRISPQHTGIELGMGEKLAEQAISLASGAKAEEIEKLYKKSGDLGNTAQEVLAKRTQHSLTQHELTIAKVYDNFYKIATISGQGSQDTKIKLLAELLVNSAETEPKTIIRFVTGRLRLGTADATILDALSVLKTGTKELRPSLERAYNLTSDLGLIAEIFYKDGLTGIEKIIPIPLNPIRPALAERLADAAAIIEKLGECVVEAKYDGFRLQCHKDGDNVAIYSRKQEPMTHMFPDLVQAIKQQVKVKTAIFEGEAIAFDEDTQSYLPFQTTITRKRKHGVSAKAKEIPLVLFAFELLYADGIDYTQKPFHERRQKLEKIIKNGKIIQHSKIITAKTPEQLQIFFDECVANGLEGIIAKDVNALYIAGARKFAWIKLKRSYQGNLADTIDAVVVGFYRGKGKRTEFGFGGLLTAVYDDESNTFKTIAKVGTGFTEEQMQWFNDTLSKIAVKEKPKNVESNIEPDLWVTPQLVVTLTADEITRSPTHTCAMKNVEGLALRFPRLTQIREDKNATDATTEKEIVDLFNLQKNIQLRDA